MQLASKLFLTLSALKLMHDELVLRPGPGRMMTSSFLIILFIAAVVASVDSSGTRDVEIDKLLKKLNKPALKSIKIN